MPIGGIASARDAANQLFSALMDAGTGQRGYLLSGEDLYLQAYNQAVQVIRTELASLGSLLMERPRDWLGGLWPGALSVLLSGLAGAYLFAEPRRSLRIGYHDDLVARLMLVIVGFGMALFEPRRGAAGPEGNAGRECRTTGGATIRDHVGKHRRWTSSSKTASAGFGHRAGILEFTYAAVGENAWRRREEPLLPFGAAD